jgi:hypothetical protein
MAITRKNIPPPEPGEVQLPNGYTNADNATNYFIPSCGIEDVDISVYELFDKSLNFILSQPLSSGNDPGVSERPTVVFAGGERFALSKKLRPVTDKNGALILPAISIRRTEVRQSNEDLAQRGISSGTGELIIESRLDVESDRSLQTLYNDLGLLSLPPSAPTTSETSKELARTRFVSRGELLHNSLKHGKHAMEYFSIPTPQFCNITYEVVFWTGYIQHMNEMMEIMLNNQLPQMKAYKLTTPKGYWFIATIDDVLQSNDNFDDYSSQEKIIRIQFSLSVKAFFIGNADKPNENVAVRRYKNIRSFEFQTITDAKPYNEKMIDKLSNVDNKYTLFDPEAPAEDVVQQPTINDRIIFEKNGSYIKLNEKYSHKGETSIRFSDQKVLETFKRGLNPRRR